jgi:DNA-binding HxlR family transcriptional regulator
LLVVRDPPRGRRYFDGFLRSPEGIATNLLSARLRALCEQGSVEKTPDPSDQRRYTYRLSDDGLRRGELLGDIAAWGLKYLPRAIALHVAPAVRICAMRHRPGRLYGP